MNSNIEILARTLYYEIKDKRLLILAVFAVVSIASMYVGNMLPKSFTSSSSILVERQNIIGPLMDGVAETADVRDLAAIVRELAYSRRSLEAILKEGGWLTEAPSLVEQELLMQDIQDATEIQKVGNNLITIEYTDTDPDRAYLVTKMYTDYVILESTKTKQRESQRAFDFIDRQTQAYHAKLVSAETALKEFRAENLDALPESAKEVNSRAMRLSRDIEQIRLELAEAQAREESLQAQLNGEVAVTANLLRENQIRERLAELHKELDTLRLTYFDNYPDIVTIKVQIEGLNEKLEESLAQGGDGILLLPAGGTDADEDGNDAAASAAASPLYQSLRAALSDTQTQSQTLNARKREMEAILEQEIRRGQRIADAEALQAELVRDYEVNKDIYQDLLKRREKARLSMNLTGEEQGFAMKLQEPPAVPLAPTGIRFMHVAAAGAVVGLIAPLGLLWLLVQFDPRVRWEHRLREELALPVLATLPTMDTAEVRRKRSLHGSVFWLGLIILVGVYGTVGWLKYTGSI